jgi:cysteine desulfurase
MFPYFQQVYGNPSSVHSAGAEAGAALDEARRTVASVLKCSPGEIIFTSGGSEADNLAVVGGAEGPGASGRHIVISAIEHEAVLRSAESLRRRGFEIDIAPVDELGLIDPAAIARLTRADTALVSVMYANNEIGTVEPVREIAMAAKSVNPRVLVHTDAVQAAGALLLNPQRLGVDAMSLSAHKFYGPRGAGVLYARRGLELEPILYGGGQERGRRSGTENVPAIVGLARALELANADRETESARVSELRDRLINGVLNGVPGAHLTGHPEARLPGHASFYFEDRSGESVLVDLDSRGIQVSSGSACHSGMTEPSRVLLAVGLPPELARNGIRMTLGRDTTAEDIEYVVGVMAEVCGARAAVV